MEFSSYPERTNRHGSTAKHKFSGTEFIMIFATCVSTGLPASICVVRCTSLITVSVYQTSNTKGKIVAFQKRMKIKLHVVLLRFSVFTY